MGTSYTAVLDRIVEAEGEPGGESEGENGEYPESSGEDQPERETGADREQQRERVELAVLLLEADGEVVDERTVPVDRLPSEGTHEGAVLEVEIADDEDGAEDDVEAGTLLEVTYDPEQERDRQDRAQDRFDRLSERLSDE